MSERSDSREGASRPNDAQNQHQQQHQPQQQPRQPRQPYTEPVNDPTLERRARAHPLADVGRDDFSPLGPALNSGPGFSDRGGGMLVGPEHPMFGQGVGDDDDDDFAGFSPQGGPERLPPDAVPPGARFDPTTPFAPMPGIGRPSGRGQRGGRGGRGGLGGFPGGDPDPDAFMPPGGGGGGSWNGPF
ncbi:hypothetical protein GGI26_003346 [Coemansia sp. RSA 1358]|nr:hypothetical protein GGI26_003346 [Coemansia sp. RSA 1358]